jgi:hypothetical protein
MFTCIALSVRIVFFCCVQTYNACLLVLQQHCRYRKIYIFLTETCRSTRRNRSTREKQMSGKVKIRGLHSLIRIKSWSIVISYMFHRLTSALFLCMSQAKTWFPMPPLSCSMIPWGSENVILLFSLYRTFVFLVLNGSVV